jgi:hypothetical protein
MISNGRQYSIIDATSFDLDSLESREDLIPIPSYFRKEIEKALYFPENVSYSEAVLLRKANEFFHSFHKVRGEMLKIPFIRLKIVFSDFPEPFKKIIEQEMVWKSLNPIEPIYCICMEKEKDCSKYSYTIERTDDVLVFERPYQGYFEATW